MTTRIALAMAGALAVLASGCTGEIRETTTPRTSTEMLLISTAAERALAGFDAPLIIDKRVQIDDSKFESVDKAYAISALRERVAESGAILVGAPKEGAPPADYVLEIRNGALGMYDRSFGIGIPALPLPVPNTSIVTASPPLYLFFRSKQEGWAKFQIWLLDPSTSTYVYESGDLWGNTYYSQWFFFGVGPFELSNDVYPEEDFLTKVTE